LNQFGGQSGQPILMIVRKAIFKREITTFDVTDVT
jgi:hypothetical protein